MGFREIAWYYWAQFWEGNGNPLQYSCLENPHGQRGLVGYSLWGHKESNMTEWLSFHWAQLLDMPFIPNSKITKQEKVKHEWWFVADRRGSWEHSEPNFSCDSLQLNFLNDQKSYFVKKMCTWEISPSSYMIHSTFYFYHQGKTWFGC